VPDEVKDGDGRTAEQFLAELFEFEKCAECGGDAADHEVGMVLGNWFAACKKGETRVKTETRTIRAGKLYLTLFHDGKILPNGFVTTTKLGTPKEIEDRLSLALAALDSVGIEAHFSEGPGDILGKQPGDGYEEV
jgi:hypothetical protein